MVLCLVPGHQLAVLSGILQHLALCQVTGPGLMHLPAYLGHELLSEGAHRLAILPVMLRQHE